MALVGQKPGDEPSTLARRCSRHSSRTACCCASTTSSFVAERRWASWSWPRERAWPNS